LFLTLSQKLFAQLFITLSYSKYTRFIKLFRLLC